MFGDVFFNGEMESRGFCNTKETLYLSLFSAFVHKFKDTFARVPPFVHVRLLKRLFRARISPDLRTLVYCTAMAHGGQDEFDFLMGLLAGDFRTSGDFLGLELSRVIVGLSCVREPWLITQ